MAIDTILIGNANSYQLTDFRDALSGSLESDVQAYASLCQAAAPSGGSWLVQGATNASPIVITSANHGLNTGDYITIINVGDNRGAHGTFQVTVIDNNTFSLNGSTGTAAWSAGGQFWRCLPDATAIAFALTNPGQYSLTILGSIGLVPQTQYAFVIYCLGAYRDYYNAVAYVTAQTRST